jgi:hypothetical protein
MPPARSSPHTGRVRDRFTSMAGRHVRRAPATAAGGSNRCTADAIFVAASPTCSYGPLPMVQGGRSRLTRWGSAAWSGARTLVVVALLAILLAACGGPGPTAAPGPIRIDPGRIASNTTAPESPVVSAWIAAQVAFEDAARTTDATAPELAATTVEPQLSWVESFVTLIRAAGDMATGPVAFGHPQVSPRGPGLTTVRACVHDSDVVVSAATGQPVAGVLGRSDVEAFTSIMEHTTDGWKLANQSVEVGTCKG